MSGAETEAAREYIDKIRKINTKYGLGNTANSETYERAVTAAARTVAPLADRAAAAKRNR